MYERRMLRPAEGGNLADLIERVLDKGVVIAGDIQVLLADVELLTIKIRLVVCSVERALAMGINWWQTDPHLRRLPAGTDRAFPAVPGPEGPDAALAGATTEAADA